MSDYKETITTGEIKSWRRASQVTINNPLEGIPVITFHEEDRIRLPNNTTQRVGGDFIECPFITPLKTFPLLHPETGVIIGSATHQDVYVLLYSLYLSLATERDL